MIASGTGTIARLPKHIRRELNRRLDLGEPGKRLVEWLNGLPEVNQPLQLQFGGRPITEQDLTAWRQGGYRDWRKRQQTATALRDMAEDVAELGQPGAEPVTDLLAAWVSSRYVAESHRLREITAESAADWRRLRELCSDVATLRRLDQTAARLRLDRERFDEASRERRTNEELEKRCQNGSGGLSPETLETIREACKLL
jgi:hypothetical protein